jgi:[protein-PII] uridylyltransferase
VARVQQSSALATPSEASVWREYLQERKQSIYASFLKRADPFKTLAELAAAVDGTLSAIWAATGQSNTACLIAVGGYGRGLLYPHSDVDVLILLPGKADKQTRTRLERLISELWDAGLEIGHSVRTIEQCQARLQPLLQVDQGVSEGNRLRRRQAVGAAAAAWAFQRHSAKS